MFPSICPVPDIVGRQDVVLEEGVRYLDPIHEHVTVRRDGDEGTLLPAPVIPHYFRVIQTTYRPVCDTSSIWGSFTYYVLSKVGGGRGFRIGYASVILLYPMPKMAYGEEGLEWLKIWIFLVKTRTKLLGKTTISNPIYIHGFQRTSHSLSVRK